MKEDAKTTVCSGGSAGLTTPEPPIRVSALDGRGQPRPCGAGGKVPLGLLWMEPPRRRQQAKAGAPLPFVLISEMFGPFSVRALASIQRPRVVVPSG